MRIISITEADLPITSPGANAVVDFSGLVTSAVAVVSDVVRDGDQLIGYGFGSIGRWGVGGILRDRLIPRILAKPPCELVDETGLIDPFACWTAAMQNEKPGGHGDRAVAMGAIDMALWDLRAKLEGVPLFRLLARRFNSGHVDDCVSVYAAGGYYGSGDPVKAVKEELQRYKDKGYIQAKIKIGGANISVDIARIEAAVTVMGGADKVAVDANGRFDLMQSLEYARILEPMGLRWFEEAGDPLDFQLQAILSETYSGPLATGENLFSSQDTLNLLRYGGMRPDRDILQFDCGLSYGLPDYLKTLDELHRHGWSRRQVHPHGGHQMSLQLAAGLGLGGNESYPGVFQPLGGFADAEQVENGRVKIPEMPGIGIEEKSELIKWLRTTFR